MQKVIDRDKEINPQALSSTNALLNLVLPPVCQPWLPQKEKNVALLRHCLNIALSIRSEQTCSKSTTERPSHTVMLRRSVRTSGDESFDSDLDFAA